MERLARQVQEVQKLLQQSDTDWKDASSAIEDLAIAVESLGYADSYKDAVQLLVGVSRDIGMQIISIRSRLVKDVCEHLLRIVKVTGKDFQELANALLPQIVSTAKSSSAAIRQPGSKLLCKVSELVRYDVSLMRKMFAQLTQDKVRVLLLEQLRVMFVYWSDDEVMAWESDVLEMIRRGLDDQNAPVRKVAREALAQLSSRWSERVDELMDIPKAHAKVLLISEHQDSPLAAAILKKNPELVDKADVLARSRRSSFLEKRSRFKKSPRHREHSVEIHVVSTPPPKQRDQQDNMTQNISSTELYTHTESTAATPGSTRREGVPVSRQLFADTTVSNPDDEEKDSIPEAFYGSQMYEYHSKLTANRSTTLPFESKAEVISSISDAISSRLTFRRSGSASNVEEVSLQHPSVKKLQESKIPSPLNRSPRLLGRKCLDSPSSASSSPEQRPSLLPRPGSFTLKARGSNGPSTPTISLANMEDENVELKPLEGRTGRFMTVSAANVETEQTDEAKLLRVSDEFFSTPIPSSMVTPTPPPPPTDNVTLRPRRRTIIRQAHGDSPLQTHPSELPSPKLPRSDELTQTSLTETVPESVLPSGPFDYESPPPLLEKQYSGYAADEVDDLSHLTDGSGHVESNNTWGRRRMDDSQSQSAGESDAVSDGNVDKLEHGSEHGFLDEWRLDEGPRHNFDFDDEIGDRSSDDQTNAVPEYEGEHTTAANDPQMDWLEQTGPSSLEKYLTMSSHSEKGPNEDSTTEGIPDSLAKDALEALLNVRDQMTRLRAVTRNEKDSSQLSLKERFASKPLLLEISGTAEESQMQSSAKPDAHQLWEEPKRAPPSYLNRLKNADHFERQASPTYAPLEPEESNFLGQEGGRTSPLQTFEQNLFLAAGAGAAEELEEQNFFIGLQARSPSRPQMVDQASPRVDEPKPEPFDFIKEPHPTEAHSPLPEEHAKTRREAVRGHEPFLDRDEAGRFDAAEKLFAANEPISTHGYYDRPDSPEPDSYMHPEAYRARAPPTPMGAKLNPAFGHAKKDVVAVAASGNDEAEMEDAHKLSAEHDVKEVLSKLSQPVSKKEETVEMSPPSDDKPDASSVVPENAARPFPELLASVPGKKSSAPIKLGWASSFGITTVVFLAAMFCMAGIMRAANKVHDSHEYHLALKSRIDMFEASIAESHEKVLKLEEDYVIWSEYVRKLTEQDEVNALTQLEAIQVEVQKWQQEMKADLVEFRQALSVESINAAFEPFRVNNTRSK